MALGDLFRTDHDVGLLTRAIDASRAALGVPGSDVTDRGRVLSSLADLLVERFDAEGDTGDLDEAVTLLRQAAAGTRPGSPRHALWLGNLGDALLARFEAAGRRLRPGRGGRSGGAGRARGRQVPGRSRTRRLRASLSPGSGRRSARGTRPAATKPTSTGPSTSSPPPWRASRPAVRLRHSLAAAGTTWLPCCGAAMRPAATRATWRPPRGAWVSRIPPAPQASSGIARQAGLARAWRDMHAVTGDARLLDDAIGGYRQALAATGPKAPVRATYLDNLGMALLDRYERSGAIDDADESVRLLRQAREATPPCSPALAGVLNNLGVALWSRSAHRPADLPEALAAFEQAVAITPARSPDAPTYLDNLANALSDRYERSGDPADLDKAVHAYEQAIAGLPASAPERLRIRANLAVGLLTRYREARGRDADGAADLERAVAELTDVVARTPPGAPALVNRLNSLGVGLKYKFVRGNDPACLQQGRAALAAAGGPDGARDIRWSLAAAATLAGWDAERAEWQEAAAGFRTAMATAESYLRVQVGRQSTEAAMRRFGGLHGDAAYALTRTGKPAEAAAAMERGRAVLLSDALDRGLVLTRLRSAGREDLSALAERLRAASNRVQELTAGMSAGAGGAQARSARD